MRFHVRRAVGLIVVRHDVVAGGLAGAFTRVEGGVGVDQRRVVFLESRSIGGIDKAGVVPEVVGGMAAVEHPKTARQEAAAGFGFEAEGGPRKDPLLDLEVERVGRIGLEGHEGVGRVRGGIEVVVQAEGMVGQYVVGGVTAVVEVAGVPPLGLVERGVIGVGAGDHRCPMVLRLEVAEAVTRRAGRFDCDKSTPLRRRILDDLVSARSKRTGGHPPGLATLLRACRPA